jgi:two-component system, sensor histidine kinase
VGKGTVVRLMLPRAEPVQGSRAREAPITEVLRGVRVLIIDDEARVRDAMQGLLATWGCDVVTAASGDEAIEHTRTRRPHVVLCDLRLRGGETGIEVLDRLERESSGISCGFVTGEASAEYVAKARAAGYPIAFKPTTPGKLRAVLEHLVGQQRALTE